MREGAVSKADGLEIFPIPPHQPRIFALILCVFSSVPERLALVFPALVGVAPSFVAFVIHVDAQHLAIGICIWAAFVQWNLMVQFETVWKVHQSATAGAAWIFGPYTQPAVLKLSACYPAL